MRLVLACVLVLATVSCSDSGNFGGEPARISTVGDLKILQPEPGARLRASSIPVSLELDDARILDEASSNLTPDTGHIHVKLDDQVLSQLAGLEFDLVEMAPEPISPGAHLLEVEFVAADHGPFSPREIEVVTFQVQG